MWNEHFWGIHNLIWKENGETILCKIIFIFMSFLVSLAKLKVVI